MMNRDQHFWARAVFVASVLFGITFLAAKYAHAGVGQVGTVGQMMAPVSDGAGGSVPNPFGIVTQADVQITTQTDQPLVTEAAP